MGTRRYDEGGVFGYVEGRTQDEFKKGKNKPEAQSTTKKPRINPYTGRTIEIDKGKGGEYDTKTGVSKTHDYYGTNLDDRAKKYKGYRGAKGKDGMITESKTKKPKKSWRSYKGKKGLERAGEFKPTYGGKAMKDPLYYDDSGYYDDGKTGMFTKKKSTYSEKFRKSREKWKKKNVRREKKGKDPIESHEYTFKYRPKGSSIFSKRKTSTVETRSEKRNRERSNEWKKSEKNPMERGPIAPDEEPTGPKGKDGMLARLRRLKRKEKHNWNERLNRLTERRKRRKEKGKDTTRVQNKINKEYYKINPPKNRRKMKHGGKVKKGGMAVIIIANKKSKK